METKQEIREQLKKVRKRLEDSDWKQATDKITEKVIQSDAFREATDIFCYMSIANEVGTTGIIEEAWRLGKEVWMPKVSGTDMDFYQVQSLEELRTGAFGVPEPSGEGEKASAEDGLMIVPGVAFDREGHRIGYGKGYYDQYIRRHPAVITMGIAFDFQLMEKIPVEEQDENVDFIVTETLLLGGAEDV